jgi:hypothetical protein
VGGRRRPPLVARTLNLDQRRSPTTRGRMRGARARTPANNGERVSTRKPCTGTDSGTSPRFLIAFTPKRPQVRNPHRSQRLGAALDPSRRSPAARRPVMSLARRRGADLDAVATAEQVH